MGKLQFSGVAISGLPSVLFYLHGFSGKQKRANGGECTNQKLIMVWVGSDCGIAHTQRIVH